MEKRADRSARNPSTRRSVFSNIASVSVGKPAIRSAPKTMSGRSRRSRGAETRRRRRGRGGASCALRSCRRRPAARDADAASGAAPLAKASMRSASASMQSIEDSRSRSRPGAARRIALTRPPSLQVAAEIRAIGGEIDAGQNDLAKALVGKAPRGGENRLRRRGARWAAPKRNDAEGAAMVAARLHGEKGAGVVLDALLRRDRAGLHDVGRRRRPRKGLARLADRSCAALPMTRATSGISAKRSGSISAAQPVTMISAPGFSRARRRIAWRACRVASAVTAHVLTMTRLSRPWSAAARRMASDSTRLSRQPKVTSLTPGAALARVTRRHPRKGRDRAASRTRRRRGLP